MGRSACRRGSSRRPDLAGVLQDRRRLRLGDSLGVVGFAPETLHDNRSVTKGVTALLYGIALSEGLVPPPADPLLRRFPQFPDLAADPQRARLTVEH